METFLSKKEVKAIKRGDKIIGLWSGVKVEATVASVNTGSTKFHVTGATMKTAFLSKAHIYQVLS